MSWCPRSFLYSERKLSLGIRQKNTLYVSSRETLQIPLPFFLPKKRQDRRTKLLPQSPRNKGISDTSPRNNSWVPRDTQWKNLENLMKLMNTVPFTVRDMVTASFRSLFDLSVDLGSFLRKCQNKKDESKEKTVTSLPNKKGRSLNKNKNLYFKRLLSSV